MVLDSPCGQWCGYFAFKLRALVNVVAILLANSKGKQCDETYMSKKVYELLKFYKLSNPHWTNCNMLSLNAAVLSSGIYNEYVAIIMMNL